jgi:hypothetical protein
VALAGGEFVGERGVEDAEHLDVLVLQRGEAGQIVVVDLAGFG